MPQIQPPTVPASEQLGFRYQIEGQPQYYQALLPDLNEIYVRYPNGREYHIHIIREREESRFSTVLKISDCMRRVFRPILACMASFCPNEDVNQIEGR